jgi:predicted methyltransferase
MAAAALAVAASAALAGDAPDYVAKALADPTRPKDDVAADALRDPADTLAFAGIHPGMTVAELAPGGGYFQRLISDVVGPNGHDYGLENSIWTESVEADRKLMAEPGRGNVSLDVEAWGQFQLPAKVDLFWITQNYHDLHIAKYGVVDIAAFNKRVFDALKPGGVYFILDHAANPGETDDQLAQLHRIEKSRVIREVEAAGFRLVAEGTFLNRPGDDHTRTIFDPAIRGHTDQYALKFVRP